MLVLVALFSLAGMVLTKFFVDNLLGWLKRKKKLSNFETPNGHWLFGVSSLLSGDRGKSIFLLRKWIKEFMQIGEGSAVLWFMHIPQIFIFNYKDAGILLSGSIDTRKGINYIGFMPWLGEGLLTSNGAKWHRQRKSLTPAFYFKMLPNFVKVFNDKGKNLVENLSSHVNEDINLIPFISKFTFESICETAMGLSSDTVHVNIVEEYHKAINDFGGIFVERFINPWMYLQFFYVFTRTYWKERRVVQFLHKVSRQVIQLRKKQFLDFMNQEGSTFNDYSEKRTLTMLDILLLTQKEDGNWDDEEIREQVDTFMFEGFDTTLICLTFTLMLLANHKEHQNRIYEEILSIIGENEDEFNINQLNELTITEMCIKESLRLYPSVPLINRIVDRDVKLTSGKVIPSKTECVIDFWSMHRDPAVYPNPETFNPDRFSSDNKTERDNFTYLPFSAGPRNCIGQKMAMLEVKCALVHILKRFSLEPVDSPNSIEFLLDILLRTSGPVRIKLVHRN